MEGAVGECRPNVEAYLFVNITGESSTQDQSEHARDGGRLNDRLTILALQPVQEGVNDDELWREHPTWRLKEFLDMLKEQYTTLELVCNLVPFVDTSSTHNSFVIYEH